MLVSNYFVNSFYSAGGVRISLMGRVGPREVRGRPRWAKKAGSGQEGLLIGFSFWGDQIAFHCYESSLEDGRITLPCSERRAHCGRKNKPVLNR
jgi:hypothetical protein